MDKSWMQLTDTLSPEYLKGVSDFIEFAWPRVSKRGMMLCPCVKCNNGLMRSRDDVEGDLVIHGMVRNYTTWHLHGEKRMNNFSQLEGAFSGLEGAFDDMNQLVRDALGVPDTSYVEAGPSSEVGPSDEVRPSTEAEKFFKLLGDAKQELYPGCERYSKLSAIVKLLHIKVLNGWSDKSFTMLLEVIKDMLPVGETLPKSYYESKKIIRDLGLEYIKIDACPNDCMLFWKENADGNICTVCGASRWKSSGDSNDLASSTKSRVPIKTLRYFPLKPRLQRLFMSSKTAEDMIWHHRDRKKDGILRHPADSKAWKHFDSSYPLFASEPRNVRLGLASDGFNPFGNMSSSYSTWPVVLVPYNLPPWLCMKQSFTMLSLLIPGPKAPGNDIDVYLQPLIEELKELWDVGAETYDAFSKENFTLRAAVMWTINDFPAYANLSGWSTKGKLACPSCNVKTDSQRLKFGKKQVYMGHRRWLPNNHKWRRNKDKFNDKTEFRVAPQVPSGDEVLTQLSKIEQVTLGKTRGEKTLNKFVVKVGAKRKRGISIKRTRGKGKQKKSDKKTNWKKRSIFFELPYWRTHLIRHNLDVMHIEKNVCESLVKTLLDMDFKSKDNANSRRDLKLMGIREDLHLRNEQKSGRLIMPAACYNMSSKEKEIFCQFLKDVKVPDGFSSNISRCVQPKERKLVGMKSHDYHVLIQRLLPLAIRGMLPENVCSPLFELSNFFSELCSKELKIEELKQLESQIAITLCQLEMIFPPSFFDVMMHLPIHLAEEAMIAGPVQYRWNYFVERNLQNLKSYVRNKSRPEGSIAEGYLAEECLTFCSRYLNDIETKFNRSERNYDHSDNQIDGVLSAFKQSGRPLGSGAYCELSKQEFEQARLYVLQNCDEVLEYIEEHKKLVPNEQLHKSQFPEWFERRVTQMYNQGAANVSEHMLSLARGPRRNVMSFKGYVVNGFRFHTKDRESQRKTQNSGVKVAGANSNNISASSLGCIEYYGVLTEIIELQYLGGHRIVLFKCDWWDVFNERSGMTKDAHGFTSVNFSRRLSTTEPFVLACQAEQVFYVKDNIKNGWYIVVKTKPRSYYNMSTNEEDEELVGDEGEPLQNERCSNEHVPHDDVDDNICWIRKDIDEIIINEHEN